MKVGCYVTVDDGGNYVTLNVGIKRKTITKAQLDSGSNLDFNARFKPHCGLVFLDLSVTISKPPRMMFRG